MYYIYIYRGFVVTMATRIDLIATWGSNSASPSVMLAAKQKPHKKQKNKNCYEEIEKQTKQSMNFFFFTHNPSSQNQDVHWLSLPWELERENGFCQTKVSWFGKSFGYGDYGIVSFFFICTFLFVWLKSQSNANLSLSLLDCPKREKNNGIND